MSKKSVSNSCKMLQVLILKISMISLGILIGARWTKFFNMNNAIILVIFAVTAVYLLSTLHKECKLCK